MNQISHIVLDFDGTCTQVPSIADQYLELYRQRFVESVGPLSVLEWKGAQSIVRQNSPMAGWMIAGCPAAPAAADPYILADESAKYILRSRGQINVSVPPTVNSQAYGAAHAPWREEALEVFTALVKRGVKLHFISNSSSATIRERLQELLGPDSDLRSQISVQSDAGKFRICELRWDRTDPLSKTAQQRFSALPAESPGKAHASLGRPVYLRRGAYFEAIYDALGGNLDLLASTVFCGDIWEMDLAMPAALGANLHLMHRASPFRSYDYELEAIDAMDKRGKQSETLSGLLDWIRDATPAKPREVTSQKKNLTS